MPQVYVGPPPNAPAPMAVKKLSGFDRVSLAPGQSRQVTIHVDARGLSYWSTADHSGRSRRAGGRSWSGPSSRDIMLQSEVAVRPGGDAGARQMRGRFGRTGRGWRSPSGDACA